MAHRFACHFAGCSVDKDGPSARRLAAKELEEEAGLDILEYKASKKNDTRSERYVERCGQDVKERTKRTRNRWQT